MASLRNLSMGAAQRDDAPVFTPEELIRVLEWAHFDQKRAGYGNYEFGIHGCCPVHGGDNPQGFTCYPTHGKHGVFVCWTHGCLGAAGYKGTDVFGFVVAAQDERIARDKGMTREAMGPRTSFGQAKAIIEEVIGRRVASTTREEVGYHEYFKAQVNRLVVNRQVDLRILAEKELENYRHFHPYMLNRGFSKKVLEEFEIGYSPKEERVTIPFRDLDDSLIAVARRVVDDSKVTKENPKYKHHSFAKGDFLFNLNRVKKIILSQHLLTNLTHPGILIVEGQLDVMRLHQYGFPLGVAVGGSSLTKHQGMLLGRFTDQVTVIRDSDAAGVKLVTSAKEVLGKYVTVYETSLPRFYKDVAEILGEHGVDLIHYALEKRRRV
jgi:5S rRNA maturation endonuclease (ribonuclease M5)